MRLAKQQESILDKGFSAWLDEKILFLLLIHLAEVILVG